MPKIQKIFTIPLLFVVTITFYVSPAFAVGSGGFENATFSSISLAQGNAVVAQAEEPAVISYNPAGISDLPGVQFQHNAAFISLFNYYKDDSSRGQSSTRSAGSLVPVPTAYLTINPGNKLGLNDRLSFGVGLDAPFGLVTQYDSTHPIVRYTSGANNELKMYSIKPTMALKVNDQLSVGAGPIYYRTFSLGTITQYPNFFIVPGSADGQLRTQLSGNRWGWHMGARWKPHKKHHFGFYFRSPVNINLKGYLAVENPVLASDIRVGAKAKLSLPLHVTGAYAFRPNEKTVIETDLGWTKWSNFKRLQIHADPVTTSAVGAINAGHDALIAALGDGQGDYVDTFSLHLGGSYKATKKLTLRAGTHFYWTPLPKHHFRPNLPDANSLGVGVGVSYQMKKWLGLDATYYNRFWFSRNVDNGISENLGPQTSVDGDYFSYGQVFSLSVRYFWDAFGVEEEPVVMQKESGVRDEGDYNGNPAWQFWK